MPDTPTKENPSIDVSGKMLRVMRGYEVYDRGQIIFMGAHDGPLMQITPATGPVLRLPMQMAVDLAAAITAASEVPDAEPGAHDAEIRSIGYEPVPRGE